MAKFDYTNFSDGSYDIEFVVNANKFSKEEVLDLFAEENGWKLEGGELREPKLEDIVQRSVRWYVRSPYWCDYEGEGIYSYCMKGERGSFPVWVIEFEKLK